MRTVRQLLFLVLVLTLFGAATDPVHAILYRHDIPAESFRRDRSDFPAVFEVAPGNGGATLIAPQWAITAAHVTPLIAQDGSHMVTIGDAEYTITQVVVHPEWGGIHFHDMALLALDRPVPGIAPMPLYDSEDEAGQTMLILGSGDSGTGLDGARSAERDGQFRGVTNMVERIEIGSLWVQFDAPDSPNATELEGIAGPGDSGGPGLIEVDGVHHLAGVASFGIEMGDPPPDPGTYGSFDTYTSVSRNRVWIDAVLNGEPVPEITPAENAPIVEVIIEGDEPDPPAPTPEQPAVEPQTGEAAPSGAPIQLGYPGLILLIGASMVVGGLVAYVATRRIVGE